MYEKLHFRISIVFYLYDRRILEISFLQYIYHTIKILLKENNELLHVKCIIRIVLYQFIIMYQIKQILILKYCEP